MVSTLAGSFGPSQFLPPSLAAYFYLPLLGANLLMVVVWLLMGRWEFLLSVAVIVLRWGTVGMYLQVGGTSKMPDREEHPMMVTLMTYNVHQFQGREDQPARSDSNAAVFSRSEADVTDAMLKEMGVDPKDAKGRDEGK